MEYNKRLNQSMLSIAVATALGVTSYSAIAAEDLEKEQDQVEIIEVTGIRSSVIKSMDIKRSSGGVVDAINSEDIGKFPDTNLAESLQRITGVSIDRKNNEGNQISVRGFGPSFNLVTLNGRQMPSAATNKQEGDSTAEQSRAFNFAELAADSVAGVEVYKTGKAYLPTGGIGATVNILTTRPLDTTGTNAFGSVKGVYDQSVETGDSVTPEVSALFSTNIDETFGFLLTASHSVRHNRQNTVGSDGWLRVGATNIDTSAIDPTINPTGQVWLPRNVYVDQSDHERERTNAQAVFQYQPSDDFELTIDYTMSDFESKTIRAQSGLWFESPTPRGTANANGSVTDISLIAGVDNNANFGAVDFSSYSDVVKTENESIGINFKWQATESLNFDFDYHDSTSEAQPGGAVSDFLVIFSGPLGASSDVHYNGGIPTVDINYDTALGGGASSYYDENYLRPNIDLARNKSVNNTVEQFQLNGAWVNLADGGLAAINFGVSSTDYSINTGWLFDLGVQGQPTCGQQCADVVTFENSQFPNVFPVMQSFNAGQVYNDFVGDMNSVFDSVTTNTNIVSEETTSAYVSFDFDTEFNGMPVSFTAGARYEQTDVTGTTIQNSPEAMIFVSPTEFRAQNTDEETEYTLEHDYSYWLPSLDVSIDISDDLVGRFSVGRTLARSDLNSMKPALSLGDARPGGPYGASQGNPGLLPYVSDNFDLALEWYYEEGSYVAVNYFKKWVDNYVVTSIKQDTIMGALGYELTDPNPQDDPNFTANTAGGPNDQTIIWDISSFDNGEAAEVDGIEVALQHLFGESGFGIQTNATFVDGDVEYDRSELNQTIALTGLSDSANFVAFYEQDGFQARIAYNWRDEFLLSTNQLRQTNEPIFVEAYGQWDISASYDVTEQLNVFLEAINITGEDANAFGRFEEQFIYHDDQEARYAIGVRFKL